MSITALNLESVSKTFIESLCSEILCSDSRSKDNEGVVALVVPNSVVDY